tara:strand:- start:22 stop:495 length:474 start_codon:yes stop_codon:yes gene_type:complete
VVDLVVVDPMVVPVLTVWVQDQVTSTHLDRVTMVDLVNQLLLAVVVGQLVTVLLLLERSLAQAVLEHHIVLLVSRHTMLLEAAVVTEIILVVQPVDRELVVMVEDNPHLPVLEMVKAELVPVVVAAALNQEQHLAVLVTVEVVLLSSLTQPDKYLKT